MYPFQTGTLLCCFVLLLNACSPPSPEPEGQNRPRCEGHDTYEPARVVAWHDILQQNLSWEGITFFDYSESSNCIYIGVAEPEHEASVEAELHRMGVPRDAVLIEHIGYLVH